MKEKTKMLVFGAIMLSIFSIFMLVDRLTGGSLIATLILIYPMPFVIYSTKYGFKNSIPLIVASMFIAIFLGHPLSIFYAIAEIVIGVVCGSMLRIKKINKIIVAIVVVIMSIFVVVASVTFLAPLLGTNITDVLNELKNITFGIYNGVGLGDVTYDVIYNSNAIYIAFTLAVAFVGIIQGILIFVVGLILNKKLNKMINKY